MGGLGAGMICLEGTGALSHVSIRNRPEVFNEPVVFAAISVKGKVRAYPVRSLSYHHIVNDVLEGVAVAATY